MGEMDMQPQQDERRSGQASRPSIVRRLIAGRLWATASRTAHGAGLAARCPERGTTLLEVLVVAVILLVGILTVVRVFPVGFDVVTRSGYITLTNRYCQTWLGELRSNPAALPDGIVPAVYLSARVNNSRWPINDDRLRPNDVDGTTPSAGDAGLRDLRNALFQFRKIHQLTVRVPRAAFTSQGGQAARVVLPISPIEYYPDQTPQTPADYYDMMTVYSLRSYYRVDRDVLSNYDGRDGYYAIDPDEEDDPSAVVRSIYFSRVDHVRTFKLDYALRSGGSANPDTESLTQKIISVNANEDVAYEFGTQTLVQLGDSAANLRYLWGSETVRRRFRDVQAENNNDPYWYNLADTTVGMLEFGADSAGQLIGIDYSVLDWQVLHDDIDVPLAPDPGQDGVLAPADQLAWVKLSFPYVVREVNDPIGSATDPRPAMRQPIIIQNIDPNSPRYGEIIDPDGTLGSWTFDDPVRGTDQALGGRIGLKVAPFNVANNEVRRIRIFYRTRDGFAAQVIKPYAVYRNAEQYNQGQQVLAEPRFDRFVLVPSGNDWWLYFTLSDVGKSVSVDYTYEDGEALRKVVGEMHTIMETFDRARAKAYGYLRLNTPGGGKIRTIDSVRGMSLEVRVAWPTRGETNRVYDILSTGWNGGSPEFWKDGDRGQLQVQSVTAAVAKPREF